MVLFFRLNKQNFFNQSKLRVLQRASSNREVLGSGGQLRPIAPPQTASVRHRDFFNSLRRFQRPQGSQWPEKIHHWKVGITGIITKASILYLLPEFCFYNFVVFKVLLNKTYTVNSKKNLFFYTKKKKKMC